MTLTHTALGGRTARMLRRLVRRHPRPWHLCANVLGGSPLLSYEARERLYRLAGFDFEGVVRPGCYFHDTQVTIGRDAMIDRDCYFDSGAPITIGDRCFIAAQCTFRTSSHELGDREQRAGPLTFAPVRVEAGCWLGARVTVLPGVTIGRGCVVAAGSVVTSDCAPDGLYAGVPATRRRDL